MRLKDYLERELVGKFKVSHEIFLKMSIDIGKKLNVGETILDIPSKLL